MNYWNHNQSERETVGYLLGDLSEDKMTDFELRYFADDELFDHMLMVKHELVDAYVRGHLDAETRDKFERHFLATPGGKGEVAFASALREKLNEAQPVIAAEKKQKSRWSELFGVWSLPQIGLAASALLLVVAGFVWQASENRNLRHELSAARQERDVAKVQSEELQRQVAQLMAPAPAPTTAPLQLPEPPAQNDDLLAINLPSSFRTGADAPSITLPANKRRLNLILQLEFEPVDMRCDVTLRTPDGANLVRRNVRAQKTSQGSIYVRADFTPPLLKAGQYQATFAGIDADNKEPVSVSRQFLLQAAGKP